jgi:hypothetical protein
MTETSELVYLAGLSFQILGETIILYSEKMEYGYNTAAQIGDKIHYLGDELPNLSTAIFAWEYTHQRLLTKEELRQVMSQYNIF